MERTGLAPWRRSLADGARGRTLDLGCGTGPGRRLRHRGVEPRLLQRARPRARVGRGQARAPSERTAPHARARSIRATMEGRVPGPGPAAVDARERGLPPEPRDGANRGAGGLRDREPRAPRPGRPAALLGAAPPLASPSVPRRA